MKNRSHSLKNGELNMCIMRKYVTCNIRNKMYSIQYFT